MTSQLECVQSKLGPLPSVTNIKGRVEVNEASLEARIAVLELEVKHTNMAVDKVLKRQEEMYTYITENKGSWKTAGLFGGICIAVGGLAMTILNYFTK